MRRNFLLTLMLLLNTSFAKGFQNNIKSIQKYQWPIDEKQGHDKNAFDEIGACLFWSKSDILWSAERRKWAASRVSGRVGRLDRMGGRRRGVQVKRWNLMGDHPVALAKCEFCGATEMWQHGNNPLPVSVQLFLWATKMWQRCNNILPVLWAVLLPCLQNVTER